MKAIVVFGGTFNPFHIGHEEMLSALCSIDAVDKVLIIPTKIPPHKSVDFLASDYDRLCMCRLVASEYKKAEVSDIELLREGKSYTIDTVMSLKELYPNRKLYLCIGGDMLASFTAWREYKEILKLVRLVAFKRQSTDNDEFFKSLEALSSEGADILVPDVIVTDVSSTEIRENMRKGTLRDGLLPSKVFDYINTNKVYVEDV